MKPKGLAKTLLGTSALTAAIVVSFLIPCVQAGTNWVGDTSIDWSDPLNWSGDTLYATGNAITINTSTGNIATITADPTVNPGDVFVGQTGTTGRLDIRSGLLRNNVIGTSGNWNFIGTGGTSANGTLNIADTSVTGQANLTTFGLGSGSYTGGKFWIGGRDGTAGGTGVMNINTTGTIAAQSTDNFGTLAAANSQAAGIILGTGATGNGTVNLVNGTVNSTSAIWVGNNGGTGLWNQAGGTTNTSSLTIARWAGTGTVNVNGGTFNATGLNTRTGLAGGGSDINGGDVSVVVSRGANNAATQQGTLNIGGTGIFNSTNDLLIAFAGASTSFGEVNVNTGGTLNVGTSAEKWLIMNRFDTIQGRLNVDGGTVNLQNNSDIKFSTGGGTGTSFVTVKNGGSVVGSATSVVDLMTANVAGNNTVNLDSGGTLTIGQIITTNNSGTATVNFNGGTLRAAGATAAFLDLGGASQRVNIRNGGAIIDTNTFDVTAAQALVHSNVGGDNAIDGGLTKIGSGKLTLSGTNTYTGATTVSAGTLALASTGSLTSTQLSVSNGATFDVSAVSGYAVGSGVTLTNNGTVTGSVTVDGTLKGSGTFSGAVVVNGNLNPGNSPGTVTFTNGLALAATSNLGWELIANTDTGAGTNFDQVLVTGGALSIADGATLNLAFGGSVDFTDAFWTSDRNWTVISFAGNGEEGALTLGSISGGVGDFNEFGSFSTSNDNGNQVLTWTAVPEPGAALLGGLGLLGLLRRRRQS